MSSDAYKQLTKTSIRDKTVPGSLTAANVADALDAAVGYSDERLAQVIDPETSLLRVEAAPLIEATTLALNLLENLSGYDPTQAQVLGHNAQGQPLLINISDLLP